MLISGLSDSSSDSVATFSNCDALSAIHETISAFSCLLTSLLNTAQTTPSLFDGTALHEEPSLTGYVQQTGTIM